MLKGVEDGKGMGRLYMKSISCVTYTDKGRSHSD